MVCLFFLSAILLYVSWKVPEALVASKTLGMDDASDCGHLACGPLSHTFHLTRPSPIFYTWDASFQMSAHALSCPALLRGPSATTSLINFTFSAPLTPTVSWSLESLTHTYQEPTVLSPLRSNHGSQSEHKHLEKCSRTPSRI